jgi:hypothetical protein
VVTFCSITFADSSRFTKTNWISLILRNQISSRTTCDRKNEDKDKELSKRYQVAEAALYHFRSQIVLYV